MDYLKNILDGMLATAEVKPDSIVDDWEKSQAEQDFNEWQSGCGMDVNYHKATVTSVKDTAVTVKVIDFIGGIKAKQGGCLVLLGGVGTGKTYTACAVMNDLQRGIYLDMPELRLKLSTADRYGSSESRESLLHRLADCSLLVLDEVGRFGNIQEQEVLFYLINKRYSNNRPTIIVSNLNTQEFAKYVGQAVIDRIRSKCYYVELTGQSLR